MISTIMLCLFGWWIFNALLGMIYWLGFDNTDIYDNGFITTFMGLSVFHIPYHFVKIHILKPLKERRLRKVLEKSVTPEIEYDYSLGKRPIPGLGMWSADPGYKVPAWEVELEEAPYGLQ